MLKKTVKYTDFNGDERSEDLYFNISKAELSRMMMEEMTFGESDDDEPVNGLADRMRNVVRRRKGSELIEMFDFIIKRAYGRKSDDGQRFIKSEEEYVDWTHSASYDVFFMELMTDTEAMVEFINNVLPSDISEKMNEDPEFQRHKEALQNRPQ